MSKVLWVGKLRDAADQSQARGAVVLGCQATGGENQGSVWRLPGGGGLSFSPPVSPSCISQQHLLLLLLLPVCTCQSGSSGRQYSILHNVEKKLTMNTERL